MSTVAGVCLWMTMSKRVTFVRAEIDQGEEVLNYLIAHITRDTACDHSVNTKILNTMQEQGVKNMICPQCGVKCVMP